ncbi:MAG TPA: AAA family ATPase [Allosphingosinicella sp.]|nr:AAA family ATPase [Allosphingosinicella sp.]
MYIEHYGLSGPPFQLTPDARFWFASRTHRKAMAYLGYGLAQAEGFIAITGEIGAGKSTLAAHLLAKIDRARLNAVEIVSTQVEGDDMLRLVAQRLGIATEGAAKAQLLERVEERLEDEYRGGKRTLIIVDEAQNLPVSALEELRMLSNFQLAGRALVQILLLGQPEFRDRIAAPGLEQLRQRIIATHHLEPMEADEIGEYVRHRLELVGWAGRPEFTGATAALFRLTGGVPRRLNQLLNRVLLHGAVEGLDRIDGSVVEAVAHDLESERVHNDDQTVLPLQPAAAAAAEPQPVAEVKFAPAERPSPDAAMAARLEALEARLEEQEATLRRVLTLLVDWAEREHAPWDQRTERRAGTERRFHAV